MTFSEGLLLALAGVCISLGIYAAALHARIFLLRKKLSDSFHRRAEMTRFLDIFARNITRSGDVENWMNVTARYVCDLTEAQSVCIFMEENGYLRAAGVFGPFPPLSADDRALQGNLLAKAKYPNKAPLRNARKAP